MNEEYKIEDISSLEATRQSDVLSRMLDVWEKKICAADNRLEEVTQQFYRIDKARVRLAEKCKDLKATMSKGNHVIRKLNSEKRRIDRAYWRAK